MKQRRGVDHRRTEGAFIFFLIIYLIFVSLLICRSKLRYDEYDLRRGPVFYEAYYPSDGHQQESVISHAERTRRTLGTLGHFDTIRIPSTNPEESTSNLSVVRKLKKFVENLERDAVTKNAANSPVRENYQEAFTNDNSRSYSSADERLDEYVNLMLRAIKNGVFKISREVASEPDTTNSIRVSRQQRSGDPRYETVRTREPQRDWNDSKRFSNDEGNYERTDDVRGPLSIQFPTPMENIFQPRPQVIKYVFSPPNNETRINVNRIKNNEGKSNEMEVGIASLEVSEVPQHKHRHHHGEKARRNKRRQPQISLGN